MSTMRRVCLVIPFLIACASSQTSDPLSSLLSIPAVSSFLANNPNVASALANVNASSLEALTSNPAVQSAVAALAQMNNTDVQSALSSLGLVSPPVASGGPTSSSGGSKGTSKSADGTTGKSELNGGASTMAAIVNGGMSQPPLTGQPSQDPGLGPTSPRSAPLTGGSGVQSAQPGLGATSARPGAAVVGGALSVAPSASSGNGLSDGQATSPRPGSGAPSGTPLMSIAIDGLVTSPSNVNGNSGGQPTSFRPLTSNQSGNSSILPVVIGGMVTAPNSALSTNNNNGSALTSVFGNGGQTTVQQGQLSTSSSLISNGSATSGIPQTGSFGNITTTTLPGTTQSFSNVVAALNNTNLTSTQVAEIANNTEIMEQLASLNQSLVQNLALSTAVLQAIEGLNLPQLEALAANAALIQKLAVLNETVVQTVVGSGAAPLMSNLTTTQIKDLGDNPQLLNRVQSLNNSAFNDLVNNTSVVHDLSKNTTDLDNSTQIQMIFINNGYSKDSSSMYARSLSSPYVSSWGNSGYSNSSSSIIHCWSSSSSSKVQCPSTGACYVQKSSSRSSSAKGGCLYPGDPMLYACRGNMESNCLSRTQSGLCCCSDDNCNAWTWQTAVAIGVATILWILFCSCCCCCCVGAVVAVCCFNKNKQPNRAYPADISMQPYYNAPQPVYY